MDNLILNLLDKVVTGERLVYKNLIVFPLYYKNGNKLNYITIDEALSNKFIEIKEINEGGSVPELIVNNISDKRILLLDGEELIGAKQNRILNTTVMIEMKTSTKIPVSCVEAGRWNYSSDKFSSSDRMSPPSLNFEKRMSVSYCLEKTEGKSFRSDQGKVWDNVEKISSAAKVSSPSMAMSDVFEGRKTEIDDYLKNIKISDGQNGMVVLINGKITGLEYVSNDKAFKKLFPKLIRGYSMDAMIDIKEVKDKDFSKDVKTFIEDIKSGNENIFKSVGLGNDHRLDSKEFIGSALIVEDEIVHLSAMKKQSRKREVEEEAPMTQPYIKRRIR
jgi:hypothetical protein